MKKLVNVKVFLFGEGIGSNFQQEKFKLLDALHFLIQSFFDMIIR